MRYSYRFGPQRSVSGWLSFRHGSFYSGNRKELRDVSRIEVTRPASPVTPPSKTVHASPDPPRRTAQVTHGKQPSRLTDYLGWKK